MTSLWPWFAVAGVGVLHGLNPAAGWAFAAAWGVRSGDRTQALRALAPIAIGHVASVALVAMAVASSVALSRFVDLVVVQVVAMALLVIGVLHCVMGRMAPRFRSQAGHAGLALWSFILSTAQGAGLMLVPALVPLCMGDTAAHGFSAPGSLALGLATVGVHTAAMLTVMAGMAAVACRVLPAAMGPARALITFAALPPGTRRGAP